VSEHKPHKTPWRVEYDKRSGWVSGIYCKASKHDTGRIVETDCGYYPPGAEDAELIVKAVNAYDALLAENAKLLKQIAMCDGCNLCAAYRELGEKA
jgi:hypothetical protein